MSRSKIVSLLPASLLVGFSFLSIGNMTIASEDDETARRPNVLLFLTDDQGFGDVASHGNALIDTPVHDSLAASGARFDRFFVSPVCAPTRSSLLTGRYHLRTGVHGVTRTYETMRSEETTLAEVLKAEGYATGCFGKWHNGAHYPHDPNGQGFDEFLGFCAGHWNNYFNTELQHNDTLSRHEGFMIDVLTDAAMEFVRENQDHPFFCYVPYNTPHSPFQVPDEFFNKYKERGLDDKMACAYGMVENIDDNMGRMLRLLDDLDLAEDTIVIFITDNGANTDRFNAGMKGRKGSLHEGGTRVPCFIRWTGRIEPGTVVTKIAAHVDILPTLTELCGLEWDVPLPLDGTSLVPLMEDPESDWEDRTFFTHWGGSLDPPTRGAVRTQTHRAVWYGPSRNWELYDMVEDPNQVNNIAIDEPELTQELSAWFLDTFEEATAAGFDAIPTEIGHNVRPVVTLHAHESFLLPASTEQGDAGIKYHGGQGWANDYLSGWTDLAAAAQWPVKIVAEGPYEVTLTYSCPESMIGSTFRLVADEESVEGTVDQAHDLEPLPSPDRSLRGEVYEKVWASLSLGVINLTEGETMLSLEAVEKPGEQMPEVKAVVLRKLE
jgi:arylsulfatase A-like enzyme